MLTAQFVARFLRARRVRRAFGHPGSDTMDLMAAMGAEGIEFILTHHENTAAYMAGAGGLLTGVPGVAIVTKGPGVTNVASGVASAHLDRHPLLVFSAMVDPTTLASNPHQELPLARLFEPITKLSAELTSANALELLPRAYQTAVAPRPGPVYLPTSAQQATAPLGAPDGPAEVAIRTEPTPPALAMPDVEPAARLLAAAKRPIAVVGPGVRWPDASADLVACLDLAGLPVCVTPEAVGQVPADHPLLLGTYGWHDTPIKRMLEAADLVVTIGLDGWDIITPFRATAPVVSLDTVEPNDRTFQPVTHALAGDLARILRGLGELGGGRREWGAVEARACYREIRERELAVSLEHDEAAGVPPQSVLTELRAVAPRQTVFACDVGAHKSLSSQAWQAFGPRSYLTSNGLSPMGFGLGAAMGAKLACPAQPVVCVVGDGGFLMYAGELATLARLNLPLVLVVMVDNSLTQIQRRQERKGLDTASTSFQRVDFCTIARGFGIEAVRADTTEAYRAAVARGLAAERPFLVEVTLDAGEYRRLPSAP